VKSLQEEVIEWLKLLGDVWYQVWLNFCKDATFCSITFKVLLFILQSFKLAWLKVFLAWWDLFSRVYFVQLTKTQSSLGLSYIAGSIKCKVSWNTLHQEHSLQYIFLSKYSMKRFTTDKISAKVSFFSKVREWNILALLKKISNHPKFGKIW